MSWKANNANPHLQLVPANNINFFVTIDMVLYFFQLFCIYLANAQVKMRSQDICIIVGKNTKSYIPSSKVKIVG